MELRRYLTVLRRRLFLIIVAVVVALVWTVVTTPTVTTYTAQTTLYIGANSFGTDTNQDLNLSADRNAGLAQLVRTFGVMIDSAPTAERAIELSGIPRSVNGVIASTIAEPEFGTNLLRVQVTDFDPSVAQAASNAMADAFVAKISELEPGQPLGEGDVPSAPVQIFERAKFPTVPTSTDLVSKLLTAGLLTLIAAAGLVLAVEYLDVTVKTPNDAERLFGLPVLGVIPVLRLDAATTLQRRAASRSSTLEAVQ